MKEDDGESDFEEEKVISIESKRAVKIERKKYLHKTGKSLWLQNKALKHKTVSVEVSTKSTETPLFYQEYQKPSVIESFCRPFRNLTYLGRLLTSFRELLVDDRILIGILVEFAI